MTSDQSPIATAVVEEDSQWNDELCTRLREWCGVHLDRSKYYLINNRLRGLMSELGFESHGELLEAAKRSNGGAIRDRVVDALTTHETLFFRDNSPFNALASYIIPEVEKETKVSRPRLRIWSAACSTGQEPYSIAIKLLESIHNIEDWNISILATVVSSGTIDYAAEGKYQEHEIRRGISPPQKKKYFVADGGRWKLRDSVRGLVDFRLGNLAGSSQPIGPFDLIFCRNVLIYFQPEDANRILRTVAKRLAPNGRLFVGCSEVLRNVDDILCAETIGTATCYRPRPIA